MVYLLFFSWLRYGILIIYEVVVEYAWRGYFIVRLDRDLFFDNEKMNSKNKGKEIVGNL